MKEDIVKNLALQAGGSHYYSVNPLQLKAMVELVVKECAQVVFTGDPQDGNRLKIGRELLDHFEIKR